MNYTWIDLDDIAIDLYENHPTIEPLKVRFTDLLNYILELENFSGKREESNEAKLEAVQMAWHEEWKDNQ